MNNLARFPISVSAVRHPRAGFESIPRDLSKAELFRYFTYNDKLCFRLLSIFQKRRKVKRNLP